MRGDLTIRKTKTASGATAVQVVRHEGKQRIVIKHIGSTRDQTQLAALIVQAEDYAEAHRVQPNLFVQSPIESLDPTRTSLERVTHLFARDALLLCASRCGLGLLPALYQDLALMRIIEPASKLRTVQLLEQYFNIGYAERTVYRQLPKLLAYQETIELAAIETARQDLQECFSLVLYDVTTLYFESFKEYDFQRPGFSKDNKPQQPQIVIGLITTRSGFPVMHEVFEGNTFEGHTMLKILRRFEQRVGPTKPIIVADAAMLSKANMLQLNADGYRYIVGARLANMTQRYIDQIAQELPRVDQAIKRFPEAHVGMSMVCQFSTTRYRKDRRELEKQVTRAMTLIERKEPGRRAKFVKKSVKQDQPFIFDLDLRAKTEKLLGIKGYVTNIPEEDMSNAEVITYYKDLWHVEQAFRMSKSDLKTRPIFHHTQESIKAHVLVCFMALMMGKYLEIKTGQSLRQVRDLLWQVHEAHLRDERTGKLHILRTNTDNWVNTPLGELLKHNFTH